MPFFRMYWRRTFRRPGAILLWLTVPFFFMAVYQMVFGGNGGTPTIDVAVVDQDSSFVSKLVRSAFDRGPVGDLIHVVDASDLAAVDRLFEAGDASAALVVPDGFGDRLLRMQPDTLALFTNPRHTIGPEVARGVVGSMVTIGNGVLGQFASPMQSVSAFFNGTHAPSADEVGAIAEQFYAASRGASGLSSLQKIDVTLVDDKGNEEDNFNMAALFFPGLVMFGLLAVSLRLEHAFLLDRRNHVTHRMVIAPVPRWRIAFEQRLYSASFAYIVGILAGTLGGLIWHIPARGLLTANLIVMALALFIAGINGIVFSLSNSPRAVSAMSSLLMIFLTILGGGFFPAEFTPPTFQVLAKWIPTGAANIALTRCLTGRDIPVSLPLLAASCIGFFGAGIFFGRRRLL